MGKLWDFLMRRKPICLTFLLIFAASVVLGNRLLAERFFAAPAAESAPSAAPSSELSSFETGASEGPDIADFPNPTADPDAANPIVDESGVSDENQIDPENPADEDPAAEIPPADGSENPVDEPAEEVPPEIGFVPAAEYFVRVISPREVALLDSIEIPRTGVAPAIGIASEDNGFGTGSNLADDAASADDISLAISNNTLASAGQPVHRSSFWSGFFFTFVLLAALLSLLSLAAHFLR